MITVDQFRLDYPSFADDTTYPHDTITYWLNLAYQMLNAARWSTQLDNGAELFTAHNVALEAQQQRQAAAGGIAGVSQGPVSSKSAGDVSISYDTTAAIELKAGHWNQTIYGIRFIHLARLMGSGGIQIVGCGGNLASAWWGPPSGWWPI